MNDQNVCLPLAQKLFATHKSSSATISDANRKHVIIQLIRRIEGQVIC